MVIALAFLVLVAVGILSKSGVKIFLTKNTVTFFIPIISGLVTGLGIKSISSLPWSFAMAFGLLAALIVILIFYIDSRMIFLYPVLLGFALLLCSKTDARERLHEEVTFNLMVDDPDNPTPMVDQDKNTHWIGTTSKNVYLFNKKNMACSRDTH